MSTSTPPEESRTSSSLRSLERPAARDPAGALVFFHGLFGVPEDFLPFLDKLDPERRFHGYLPQAPHEVNDAGRYTWKDPSSSESMEDQLRPVASWLDALPFESGRVVLAGWSQGAGVAYVLGLAAGRPRPAGLIALGGMWSTDDVQLDLSPPLPPVAIGHGRLDDAVDVESARKARASLEAAGATVMYRETEVGHVIDQAILPDVRRFLATLP